MRIAFLSMEIERYGDDADEEKLVNHRWNSHHTAPQPLAPCLPGAEQTPPRSSC
jgi:hypothetical protein